MSDEIDFQLNYDLSEDQIARAGKKLGVDYMAVVRLQENRREMEVFARLIDVTTAEIEASCEDHRAIETLTDLYIFAERLANQLVQQNGNNDNSINNGNNSNNDNKTVNIKVVRRTTIIDESQKRRLTR